MSRRSTATSSRNTRCCCTSARSSDRIAAVGAPHGRDKALPGRPPSRPWGAPTDWLTSGCSPGLRGVAQQALGRRARFGADFDAAEHARQFLLALPCIELLHRAMGAAVAGGLSYPVLLVAPHN